MRADMSNIENPDSGGSFPSPPAAFVACLLSVWAIAWALFDFLALIDLPISSLSILKIIQILAYLFVIYLSWKVLLFFAVEMKAGLAELKRDGTKWQFLQGLLITFVVTPGSLGLIWFMYQVFIS